MHRFQTVFLFLLCFSALGLPGQLDTLYFEDFVDNRKGWKEFSGETGSLEIADGYLNVTNLHRKNSVRFTYITLDMTDQDTFVYEVKIVPETFTNGGIVYNINHRKPKGDRPPRLCCYTTMIANKRGLYCYQYNNSDGHHSPHWNRKLPELQRDTMTFKLAYGGGKYHCYYNGEWIASHNYRFSKLHPVRNRWGWRAQGYAKFKVDYMVLLGKKKGI